MAVVASAENSASAGTFITWHALPPHPPKEAIKAVAAFPSYSIFRYGVRTYACRMQKPARGRCWGEGIPPHCYWEQKRNIPAPPRSTAPPAISPSVTGGPSPAPI